MKGNAIDQFYKLSNLTGCHLNADDGKIGKLEEILFDDQCWIVRYFIVDTGSWLMQRKVLISPDMIIGVNKEEKTLNFCLSREQVENCPPVDTKLPVSRHYKQEYHKHYGKNPYWSGTLFEPAMFEPAIYDAPPVEGGFKEPQNPHLRSSSVVKNYSIRASDGDIGKVDNFILRKEEWEISYMEISTGKWLPGKHVLIAPTWIRNIDWAKQEVKVSLNREAIETALSYTPLRIITREYQAALYEHYEMSFEDVSSTK